jgi:subtilisin-like proprotein convertase family protein
MKRLLTRTLTSCALGTLLAGSAYAETFTNNTPVAIPDNTYNGTQGTMTCSTVDASSIPAADTVTNVSLTTAITHTWVGDLTIKLISPSSSVLGVLSRPGVAETADDGNDTAGFGESANLLSANPLSFNDADADDAETMGGPLTSTQTICLTDSICDYHPNPGTVAGLPNFAGFNGGQASGTWTLCIADSGSGDTGSLDSWSITIDHVGVTHTVTPSVGTPSGSISPNTPQVVNDGATTAFTLTPDAGFHIDTVGGTCGGTLAANTYTTNAITADCTVIANFAADGGGGFPPDEDFDEVTAPALPAGWVTSTTTGSDFTTVTNFADTAPNAAFAIDLASVNDFTLDSPSFVPLGTTTLTFRHQFNLEDTFDGAVLEISINGGPFTDIVTAGGSFGSGGYTDTISSNFSSPIAGRQAWSGSSGGFITTVATLPAAATGQPTVLRFRTADDVSVAPGTDPGWWVDSIHLSFATIPSVAKAFAPSAVQIGVDSTLTITLTNPTTGAATLTGDLVDTLPAGLVATAASATTTCIGGAGASNTSGSVTLGTGAVIPPNATCVVAVTVNSATAGSYVNTIPAGALQTDIGNSDTDATATLTVQSPPVAVVTPNALSISAAAGGTGSTPLNIANTGGSTLTYSISEGTTSVNGPSRLQGSSYKTVSKQAIEMRAKYGPASLSANPRAGMAPAMHRPVKPLGALQISQMADNTPGDEGVSCGVSGTSTTANSWWRRFYFNEHPGVGASTSVTSVTISSGSSGPSGVPVTINLYTIPHGTAIDTIPTASLTPIGTGTGTIDSGLVSVTIPVSGAIADTAGNDLVVEYHIDAVATGQFFPGANATAETHPTFLSAADCGVNEPTPASAIGSGFPNFHLTMIVNVGGTPPATCANPADIPWLSEAPAGGSVAAGANTDVTVTADAASLAEGTYTANVCVGSNDPVTPLVTVPVTLTVGPAPFVLCPNNPEEIFCDGFDPAGGQAGTYTDRTTFLTHVAAGFFENGFDDAVPGAIPSMNYTNGGWAYTVTASQDQLFNDTGLISTNQAAAAIVVTFTGDPVTAVGGNFWSTDINVQPTGTDTTVTLSDGTTETFTSTGPTDFRGFTTVDPVTSITIDAPDTGGNFWPTMDNLIVGTGQ